MNIPTEQEQHDNFSLVMQMRNQLEYLKHGPDVLQVCSTEEGRLSMADRLH